MRCVLFPFVRLRVAVLNVLIFFFPHSELPSFSLPNPAIPCSTRPPTTERLLHSLIKSLRVFLHNLKVKSNLVSMVFQVLSNQSPVDLSRFILSNSSSFHQKHRPHCITEVCSCYTACAIFSAGNVLSLFSAIGMAFFPPARKTPAFLSNSIPMSFSGSY